jgi:hypothetical protein
VTSIGPPIFGGQLGFDFDLHLAGRELVLGLDFGALNLEQVELVAEEAVLHVAGDAAGKAGQRIEHAVGVRGHVHVHAHQAVHLPSLGAADSGIRVMGPSKVHS